MIIKIKAPCVQVYASISTPNKRVFLSVFKLLFLHLWIGNNNTWKDITYENMGFLWLHELLVCFMPQSCHDNPLQSWKQKANFLWERNLWSKLGLTMKTPSIWVVHGCHCWYIFHWCLRNLVTCVYIYAGI